MNAHASIDEQVVAMSLAGVKRQEIAATVGVSVYRVNTIVDPTFRPKAIASCKAYHRRRRAGVAATKGRNAPVRPAILACTAVLDAACDRFSTSRDEITGRSRAYKTALIRQIVMYVARTSLGLSSPTIGMVLDRDHSTVLHGANRVRRLIEASDRVGCHVEAISAAARRLSERKGVVNETAR